MSIVCGISRHNAKTTKMGCHTTRNAPFGDKARFAMHRWTLMLCPPEARRPTSSYRASPTGAAQTNAAHGAEDSLAPFPNKNPEAP